MNPSNELLAIGDTWSPPEELLSTRPREIRLTGLGKFLRIFSILMAVGSIALGIILYLKASSDLAQREDLTRRGISSSARITRLWKTSGKETRFWIAYAYPHAGQEYQGRIQLGRRDWAHLTQDSSIPVRFLPEDPGVHYLPGREGQLLPLWVPFLITPVLLAIGWLMHRSLASQSRLLMEGRPAPALVTEHKKVKNGQETHYTFLLLNRAAADGKMDASKNPPPLGGVLCVLYEPDRPRHNQVYPLSLVRTARAIRPLKKKA
jgi:hypothetical protein